MKLLIIFYDRNNKFNYIDELQERKTALLAF